MNFSKEQKDYIIHALEHCEVLTGGRSSGKTLELIKQQNKEIERLNNIINEAIEYIENNDLYEQDYDYDYEENLVVGPPSDETARKILLEILDKVD